VVNQTSKHPSIADFRRFYAEFVVRGSGSSNATLIEAFASVQREDFVGPGPWDIFVGTGYLRTISDDPCLLYQDVLVALAPERQINNGQPSLHARCLDAIAPAIGESVAHLGAGTGYYTAILSTLVGPTGGVFAVEREADLADRARKCLEAFPNVKVHTGSATEVPFPPCDVIYVNAGATDPAHEWLGRLRVGGRLVLPLTGSDGIGFMLLVTKKGEGRFAASALMRAAFIPCMGARNDDTAASITAALERQSLRDVRSLRLGTPPDACAWCVGDGWWLSKAELDGP